MAKQKINVAVLVSGGGTNLQALINAERSGILKSGQISLVVSNCPDAYALVRARAAGIPSIIVSKSELGSQEAFEDMLISKLEAAHIDLIVLAGFMTILTEKFTKHFAKRIINIHPSLIPSFCGKGYYGIKVHEAVLARGVKITGATVHYVNEIPDGGEIIMQKAVAVLPTDTPDKLQKRVMRLAEWRILPAATEKVCREMNK